MECPICTNKLYDGEYVSVGVGFVKVTPAMCEYCWWVESSGFVDNSAGLTDDQRRKLWELSIPEKQVYHEYFFNPPPKKEEQLMFNFD